jgi:hypothetical protein
MTTLTATIDNAKTGYQDFSIGSFTFRRNEYFAYVDYPDGEYVMPIDAFLKALMRDIAWGFFYGTVNFDEVFGTTNHYGNVDLFIGATNEEYVNNGKDFMENFPSEELMEVFQAILSDWTIEGFDPFAAPQETGTAWGPKNGNNDEAISRTRQVAQRMIGMPGDTEIRSDETGYTVNRHFKDVDQSQPKVYAEPGFEDQIHGFNLWAHLSRSDVTWNPSIVSICKQSLLCPTTEEYILPVEHGNDRVEWFLQVSDEIVWDIKDGKSSKPRASLIMRAGDVACMPADIRHQGFSPKRSMLIVWENGSPEIMEKIKNGTVPRVGVEF